jgi:prefoldin subunit 5
MSDVTLEFLGRQLTRLIEDIAAVNARLAHIETEITDLRGGMDVQLAMLQRQHGTLQKVVTELGEIHQLDARMYERLRKLEDVP